jgi:hypothetical protein
MKPKSLIFQNNEIENKMKQKIFYKINSAKFLKPDEKGYTLLFAVLVASLVLSIGISILTISRKEFLIATSTRDSAAAFYAADGGLECAIYNLNNDVFNITTDNTGNFDCDIPHGAITHTTPASTDMYTFHAKLGGQVTSCAVVTVTQESVDQGDGTTKLVTTVKSLGYNTGWDSTTLTCSIGSAKRVERGLSYKRS